MTEYSGIRPCQTEKIYKLTGLQESHDTTVYEQIAAKLCVLIWCCCAVNFLIGHSLDRAKRLLIETVFSR